MSILLSVLGVLAPGLAPAARLIPTLSHSLLASESEIPTAFSSYLHSSTHSVLEGRKSRGVRWPRGRASRSKWVTILLA